LDLSILRLTTCWGCRFRFIEPFLRFLCYSNTLTQKNIQFTIYIIYAIGLSVSQVAYETGIAQSAAPPTIWIAFPIAQRKLTHSARISLWKYPFSTKEIRFIYSPYFLRTVGLFKWGKDFTVHEPIQGVKIYCVNSSEFIK
jgi:hypothetical protein